MGKSSSSLRKTKRNAGINATSSAHVVAADKYGIPAVKIGDAGNRSRLEKASMAKGSLVYMVKPVGSTDDEEYRPVLCLSDIRPGSRGDRG